MERRVRLSMICSVFVALFLINCSSKYENTTTSADGVQIHFEVAGHGEPALVFVHGFAGNNQGWESQLAHFSKKHRVVAVELAGFGASGNNRENWSMEAFGGDVVSVIKHLRLEKVILVGHSMGGPVILEAAKQLPGKVMGLVPVDVFQNVEAQYTDEEIDGLVERIMSSVHQPDEERLRSVFKRNVDPATIEKIVHYYESSSKIGWRECLRPLFQWMTHSLPDVLQSLQCPIICINSDRRPTELEIARKYHPTFDVRIVPNTGHPVMLDAPEEFNRSLEEIIERFNHQK